MNELPTLKTIVDDYDDLCFPIIIRGTRIIVLRICEGDSAHSFGGDLPVNTKTPSKAIIHNLATIHVDSCEALSGLSVDYLHLLYAFRHDGDGLKYKIKGDMIKVSSVSPSKPDSDWPYEDFPNVFAEKSLEVWGVIEADEESVYALFHQGMHIPSDDEVIAVFPPSDTYGVSLWGEYGDPEMVQCIFEYNHKKGKVNTYNQCG